MIAQDPSRPYVVISADTHAGAELHDYKRYLASEFHDDFDAWASEFDDAWSAHEVEEADPEDTHDENLHIGVSSFLSPYNWDSDQRLAHLDGQGIVGEVVLPNTVPPFYPNSVISAPAPTTKEEYRYRWAGLKAHNRWLSEFCGAVPGRRAGIAQVFLNNIEDAIEEVKWAKENGLAGVIIPADHHRQLVNVFELRLDPFWAACSDLDIPVHRHSQAVADAETPETGPAAPAIGMMESLLFLHRTVGQLMIGGVFQRHPKLKFVFTEAGSGWATGMLDKLDRFYTEATTKGSMMYTFGHRAVEGQTLLPSEYARRNVYFGGFMTDADVAARDGLGIDNIMWGSDYPHHEGTYPFTDIALRMTFSDVPSDEVRKMTSINAASVYGFDLTQLQAIADKLGPTVEEVATPVSPAEIPSGTVCPTFVSAAGSWRTG
jgi:predicted TIM-barrel fold metal-dependent hydrolase